MTSIFSEQTIVLGMKVSNAEEAIRRLGKLLLQEGIVKDTYIEGVIEREKTFPTGLPVGHINVALPHADAIHVNRPGIALGILVDPVDFHVMGNVDQIVPVDVVFLMAIQDCHEQIKLLQKFGELLQNRRVIESIMNAETASEIVATLSSLFEIRQC